MAETITFSTTNKGPTRDGEISSQITCEGPAEHVMIILDKFARGTVHESQGGERFRTELKEYPYERAARLIRELRAPGTGEPFDVEVPEGGGSEDAEATALDDRVDDVLGELGEVVSQTSIRASLSRDSEDEPVVELVVEYKDRELVNVRSRLSELQDIDIPDATALEGTDMADATALEGGPPDGEEAPEEEEVPAGGGRPGQWSPPSPGAGDRVPRDGQR